MVNQSIPNDKSQIFRKLLHDLAKTRITEETAIQYYQRFEEIYREGYRHLYSDISRVIYDIAKYERAFYPHSRGNLSEDMSTLISNSQYLYANYASYRNNLGDNQECYEKIRDSLRKLYDHIALESLRMNYSDIGDKRLSEQSITLKNLTQQVDDLDDKAQSMGTEFEEIHKKSKDIEDKLSKAQTDYIAILGIFASVVLAFVGGMAFSTSVLENIKDVSIYRLLIVALIIGIVFVTVIFLMFYFIGVLTGRHLNDERSMHPLLLSYGVFILLIAIVYAMWYHGDVETRNKRVDDQATIVETSAEPDVTSQIYFEQNNATTE